MEAVRGCKLRSPFLTCTHCHKQPEQPRLCPRCAAAFCNSCLLLSLNSLREECPACGVRVREEEFLQAEVVVGLVGGIVERVKREGRRGEQRQQCTQHQLPLGYFCTECNHPLCSDCALLTNSHTGHKFVSYRDIYERIKKRVFDQFPRFDRKIAHLTQRKAHLMANIQTLYDDYRRFKKVFEQAYISYTERVQAAAKTQEHIINTRFQSTQHRLSQLEHLRDNIYEQMEKKTQLTLIKQSNALAQSVNALTSQEPPLVLPHKPQDNAELQELIPDYTTWTYRLENLSTRTGIVYSEGRNLNGVEWRLKVYPKGNGLAREKYLSVFVEMSKALGALNKYEYRIELLNPVEPAHNVKREYCSTFQIGECWGYNQFEPLEQLTLKQFIEHDSLLFRIGVRNRNYRSLVLDQELYIQQLKTQIKEREKVDEDIRARRVKLLREKDGPSKKVKQTREKEQLQEVPFRQSHEYGVLEQYLKKKQ